MYDVHNYTFTYLQKNPTLNAKFSLLFKKCLHFCRGINIKIYIKGKIDLIINLHILYELS